MKEFFNKPDVGILVFRVIAGILLAIYGIYSFMQGGLYLHGMGKNMSVIGITFKPFLWGALAALTYTVGGVLLVFGIFFRYICFSLFFIMCIALSAQIQNGIGLFNQVGVTAFFTAIFLSFLFIGPGKYSLKRS